MLFLTTTKKREKKETKKERKKRKKCKHPRIVPKVKRACSLLTIRQARRHEREKQRTLVRA